MSVLSTRKLKMVSYVLALTISLVIIAIGLVYYYKIDYFLPPALSLALIPLIIQFRASILSLKRRQRVKRLKDRVRRMEENDNAFEENES